MNMSLEQVRDALKGVWVPTHWGTDGRSYKMSDLIESLDHYLSQPQPVAQGEAVGILSIDNFRDCRSMQNVQFDYTGDLPVGTHKLYATPTIPTGHRVVPVEPTEDMALAAAKSVSGEWDDESADVKVGLVEIQRAAIRDAIAEAPDAGGV